jgi:hypothetical protein
MPALDKLLNAMDRFGAEEVVLESGQPPCVVSQEGARPLNGRQLSSGQILGLLAEVAPADFKEQVKAQANLSFQYTPPSSSRPLVVDLSRVQGALRANLKWAPAHNGNGNGHPAADESLEIDLPAAKQAAHERSRAGPCSRKRA